MKNFDRAYFGAQLLAAIYWGDRLVWPDEAPSLVAPTVALTVSPTEDIHVGDTVTVQIALTGVPMPTMSEVTISATIDGTPITLSGTGAARTWVATQAGELIVAATVSTAAGSAEATVSSEIAVPDQLSIVFEPDVLRVGVPVTLTVMLGDEPTAPTMIAAMLNGSPVALTGTGPTRSLTPASEGTLQVSVDLTGSESISVSLPVEMARPAFYPDVPPVDLTKATGSVKFPDNNWEPGIIRAGAPELKGMINQSRTNFNRPGALSLIHI